MKEPIGSEMAPEIARPNVRQYVLWYVDMSWSYFYIALCHCCLLAFCCLLVNDLVWKPVQNRRELYINNLKANKCECAYTLNIFFTWILLHDVNMHIILASFTLLAISVRYISNYLVRDVYCLTPGISCCHQFAIEDWFDLLSSS